MRDCNKCIHHTSGSCSSFDCKMQTVEDVAKEAREKAITEFVAKVVAEINNLPTHKEVATSEKHPFSAYEAEMISKHKVVRIVKKGGAE